jgi:5-methylcytosine-specific restriction enzyme A
MAETTRGLSMNQTELSLCYLCQTDPWVEKHHILPKSKGGAGGETIPCCSDCGGQIHMLFTNKELEHMSLKDLLNEPQMVKYLKWKRKHPGDHRHKASNPVKNWRKSHRG